jgi:lipoate-protein ligase A
MTTWRLILDGPADGVWNMAVDRALLTSHERDDAPPTVRLYRWNRPTVSLGHFQELEDVDADVCAERGVGLCRRPTGGRGVLHDDEITYSIVAGVRDGLPRGVSASYRMLCGALAEAYREAGIPADLTGRPRGEKGAGACYLHATHADLSLGAAKLSGSAQVWSKDSCLQHGSFVISRDVGLEAAVFGLDSDGRAALEDTTATISRALGRRPDETELAGALTRGLARGLGVSFREERLPSVVQDDAREWLSAFRIE